MSRTIAHTPWSVLVARRPDLRVEVHDHRSGVCDLPSPAEYAAMLRAERYYYPRLTHCRWDLDWQRMWNICGCALCTGKYERRAERRRSRRNARREPVPEFCRIRP